MISSKRTRTRRPLVRLRTAPGLRSLHVLHVVSSTLLYIFAVRIIITMDFSVSVCTNNRWFYDRGRSFAVPSADDVDRSWWSVAIGRFSDKLSGHGAEKLLNLINLLKLLLQRQEDDAPNSRENLFRTVKFSWFPLPKMNNKKWSAVFATVWIFAIESKVAI